MLLPATLSFLFPCELSCNARCRQVLQHKVFLFCPHFSSPLPRAAREGSPDTRPLLLGACRTPLRCTPVPPSAKQGTADGKEEARGTPAGHRLLGKPPTTACQACLELRAPSRIAPLARRKVVVGGCVPPSTSKHQTQPCLDAPSKGELVPPSDFQTQTKKQSHKHLKAQPTDQLA